MGLIVGVLVLVVAALLLTGSLRKSTVKTSQNHKVLRPYIGLFLIAGLVAVASLAVGALFSQAGEWMLIIAKVIAVIACVSLCVHLAVIVAKHTLGHNKP